MASPMTIEVVIARREWRALEVDLYHRLLRHMRVLPQVRPWILSLRSSHALSSGDAEIQVHRSLPGSADLPMILPLADRRVRPGRSPSKDDRGSRVDFHGVHADGSSRVGRRGRRRKASQVTEGTSAQARLSRRSGRTLRVDRFHRSARPVLAVSAVSARAELPLLSRCIPVRRQARYLDWGRRRR